MSSTSQNFTIGQQVPSTCSSPRSVHSLYEMNWQSALLCSDQAGTPLEQCDSPGIGKDSSKRDRTSNVEMLAQNFFTMKNARKQLGEIASKDADQINPGSIISDNPESFPLFENSIFREKPRSRQPESSEEESFRSWLQTNTPRQKASPALLERIKMITHDDKA